MYSLSELTQNRPDLYNYYSQNHSRHIIIWGEGGARPDFLVKFLLQHSDACSFEHSNWIIDTNGSSGKGVPTLGHDLQISQSYDPSAGFIVSKCHWGEQFLKYVDQNNVDMIRIVYDNTDIEILTKIIWEYTAKSGVHAGKVFQKTVEHHTGKNVVFNKSEYFDFVKNVMLPKWYCKKILYPKRKVLEIDYKHVVSQNGPGILCRLLNLPFIPAHAIQYIENLKYADSPLSVHINGEHWSKTEIRDIVESFIKKG